MNRILLTAIGLIVAGGLGMGILWQSDIRILRASVNVPGAAPITTAVPANDTALEHVQARRSEDSQNMGTTAPSIAQSRGRSGSGVYINAKYGFQLEFPPGWSYWEQEKRNGTTSVSVLQFVPVPEGTPWGDSFGGFVGVRDGVEDFQEWFEGVAQSEDARIASLMQAAESMYGPGYWSTDDFETTYEEAMVDGHDAIVRKTTCLKEDCYFLGAPRGYEEIWFIYNKPMIVTVHVLTYERVERLDSILASFKFLDR